MHTSQIAIAALAAFAPFAQAVGQAFVKNKCDHDVFLWSVGGSVGPEVKIEPGNSYAEEYRRDPTSGGIALKITTVDDGLYAGAPQTTFAYNLDNDKIWYDLSNTFGAPFEGKPLRIQPSDTNCAVIDWPNGISPGGSQTRVCQANSDLTMTLC